ncbi:MAG TPA: PAC2 family protein [Chloroflexia bacterium]|nr:PAC2 family protein [Chloroflexia bacterium]
MADYIRVSDWPQLHDTLLIAAFSGWNDAADSATTAVKYIEERLSLKEFATIDPEEFYVFSDTRPLTRLNEEDRREISWPANQFSYISEFGGQNRSLVTLSGVEPDLKWRTFSEVFFEICRKCNVTEVVLVGSLLAPVPHTRQVPLTGFSSDETVLASLRQLGATQSRYEGPTGIVGVLSAGSEKAQLKNGSLWGAAPSYLSASPNWKVTSRLLSALNEGWKLGMDLEGVQGLGMRFEAQVSEAVSRQEDVASFVHDLEEHYDEDDGELDEEQFEQRQSENRRHRDEDDSELPSADIIIQELEKHLNLRRDDEPPGGPQRQ